MAWEEWVDIATIKACVRHATGVVPALAIALGIRIAIQWTMEEGPMRTILEGADTLWLVVLCLYLIYQTAREIMKGRDRNGRHLSVLVA